MIKTILIKVVQWIIPNPQSSKKQVKAIDSLISLRGKTTMVEVILAYSEKIITRAIIIYLLWGVFSNNINIIELFTLIKGLFK